MMALTASQHRKAVREGVIADSDQRSAISRKIRSVQPTRSPQPEARSLLRSGIDFARAMSSGAASEEVTAKRLAVCAACPGEQRYTKDGKDHCRACGCPAWRFARLDKKAALAMDTCTPGYWKEVKSEE